VAETYHLQQRAGTWYYHRRVPNELVKIVGKTVIKRSLRTGNKAEAKRLRSISDVETDQWFANLSTTTGGKFSPKSTSMPTGPGARRVSA
jgi:hypothetical protein